MRKKLYVFLLIFFLFLQLGQISLVKAEDPTPTPTPSATPTPDNSGAIQDLQNKIKDYEGKIADAKSQEKTLSSQITIMDNQIKLTQLRIETTKRQIAQLDHDISTAGQKIAELEDNITETTKALVNRISVSYQVGRIDSWQLFLTSSNISNFMTRLTYLKLVEANDKKTIYAAQESKVNYANEKDVLTQKQREIEALKQQLTDYTEQLNKDKDAKEQLLADTKGSEENYQKLLAQAQAQLAGFTAFTSNAGGASLLSGQTNCDSWGCYYNQRDSSWGGVALNHTGYTIASDGCLVTSMAMVYTHYGHRDVTPLSVNSNPDNFASYYPAYLRYSISANGVSSSRVGAAIDSTLAGGDPVVVGVHAYGGTHFVVLKSGSNGDYVMNDPYVPNGHDIKFTDHYSMGSIFEVDKVTF
ncbi:MAG: hypothetical protein ACM3IJ_03005 [Candidatus Levyibacteriota bacterium]